jgi:adenylate cyclase, class 2
MEHLEIEVKFYAPDIDPVRKNLVESGAVFKEKVFETNMLFDDINKNLTEKKSLLRLRRDKKNILTFKSLPRDSDKNFKILRELEVDVSNFDTMRAILESLGFHHVMTYEKWRETFESKNGTHICIDNMPYGDFIEIEGKKREEIKTLSHVIGLPWKQRIILNYHEIFEIIRQDLNLKFSDITFDNFKNLNIDLQRYMASFIKHPK